MDAPSVSEMLKSQVVADALDLAWNDSCPHDREKRHEEGGWIFFDPEAARLSVMRVPRGAGSEITISDPPLLQGLFVVATFHTHPHPRSEGWDTGPSVQDEIIANTIGLPCIIRAEDGIYSAGPFRRRGGLTGPDGYPFTTQH